MSSEVKKLNGSAFKKYEDYWSELAKVEEGEDPFASFKAMLAKKNRVALLSTKKNKE